MQYTIRDIPNEIDKALRAKALAEGKSLNQAAVELLRAGLHLEGPVQKRRDLNDICGTWIEDAGFDEAIREFEQVDPEDWK